MQSTERCRFSYQENLKRLQKCIKGAAFETVRGKLMMPSTVTFATCATQVTTFSPYTGETKNVKKERVLVHNVITDNK